MKVGRPTDCTEAVIQKVERAARLGVTMRNLHKHAGVDVATFWRWMGATEGIQAEFRDRINAARCDRELECIEEGLGSRQIESQSEGEVVTAARMSTGHLWLLERSYGYRRDVDNDAEPITASARTREDAIAELRKLPPDLLRAALEPKE